MNCLLPTLFPDYATEVMNSLVEAMILLTNSGQIRGINQAAEGLFGYSEAELVGQPITLLTPQQEFPWKQLQQQAVRNLDLVCQTKRGKKLIISFSCSFLQQEEGLPHYLCLGRDVTQTRKEQQRQAVQYSIAQILSHSPSLQKVTPRILQAICRSLGWEIGELWTPEKEDDYEATTVNSCLRRVEIWSNIAAAAEEFIEVTKQVSLPAGMGLAGRVWANNSTQWISNITKDPDFGQNSFAVRVGLKSAFGFPIKHRGKVLGVMTFFSQEIQAVDREVLKIMIAIGNQLGQFLQRRRAEKALQEQQQKTEKLLRNILPDPIVERLKRQPSTIADSFDEVTVLFADLVGFTELSSALSPIQLLEKLNQIFSTFDYLSEKYGLEKIKTIGDAYMVVGGLPEPRPDHAVAIAAMALEMQTAIASFNEHQGENLSLRIGIHTGPVVAGVIGTKKFSYDLWGDTVNTASRMESQGLANAIQITEETYHRLQNKYACRRRGLVDIKGKGKMNTYLLLARKATQFPNYRFSSRLNEGYDT